MEHELEIKETPGGYEVTCKAAPGWVHRTSSIDDTAPIFDSLSEHLSKAPARAAG